MFISIISKIIFFYKIKCLSLVTNNALWFLKQNKVEYKCWLCDSIGPIKLFGTLYVTIKSIAFSSESTKNIVELYVHANHNQLWRYLSILRYQHWLVRLAWIKELRMKTSWVKELPMKTSSWFYLSTCSLQQRIFSKMIQWNHVMIKWLKFFKI